MCLSVRAGAREGGVGPRGLPQTLWWRGRKEALTKMLGVILEAEIITQRDC